MKIVVAVPHSHTWFWTQTCAACLQRYPPKAEGCDVEVVFVDNSPWSPAIRGITDTALGRGVNVVQNTKSNRFHASALDLVVESFEFDYLMALETDVMVLRPDWLQWFVDSMCEPRFAVGAWHHEEFVNPSCTLYNGDVLREMLQWCLHEAPIDELRWGPSFSRSQPVADRQPAHDYSDWFDDNISWLQGPFAEKRGWPAGTVLKSQPSGQMKGPGWYEPGQQLHHWAVDAGYRYYVCPTLTTNVDGVPVQTMYGTTMPDPLRQLEAVEMFGNAYAAHLWGGTRALDILKHEVTCQFVKKWTPYWLAREARFWKAVVPGDVQAQTLDMIRQHGLHTTGQGNAVPGGDDRDRAAAAFVRECYKAGGVEW